MEPTNGQVEAGCQGTLRVEVAVPGRRAHSARSWLGENAVHAAAPLLATLAAYEPRAGRDRRLHLPRGPQRGRASRAASRATSCPTPCTVTVNFRFAPDRSEEQALEHVREVLAPYALRLTDSSPGALPGLSAPAAAALPRGGRRASRSRSTAGPTSPASPRSGIPAVNYGPGDPGLAHTREEHVRTPLIHEAAALLRRYLSAGQAGSDASATVRP